MTSRPVLFETIRFSWSGATWTVNYAATPVGEADYRGQAEVLEATWDRNQEGRPAELTPEEMAELIAAAAPGAFDIKAAYWAKRALFGDDHPLVKVPTPAVPIDTATPDSDDPPLTAENHRGPRS